jgi:hypothetical protein
MGCMDRAYPPLPSATDPFVNPLMIQPIVTIIPGLLRWLLSFTYRITEAVLIDENLVKLTSTVTVIKSTWDHANNFKHEPSSQPT